MRSGGNPLDLNNLPDDYPKQVNQDDTSSSAVTEGGSGRCRKKKISGGAGGKESCTDESAAGAGKRVYECRFCSLKFSKSQALGGHMNRHRQERETETLDKARQLVFGTADTHLPPPPPPPYGGSGGGLSYQYHQQMRSISSSAPRLFSSYPSNYQYPTANELCYMGHVVSPHHANANPSSSSSYAGAPVGQSFPARTGPGHEMDS